MDQSLFSAGSKVGTYLILEKLGEGGMSEVFKAIEPTLERYVAIKIMHRTNLSSPDVMANFLEEARAIAGLRHMNIVPLYSAGEEQGVPYLAMGFIEGQTLEDWILAGRILTVPDAMWFMEQAVAALEYASRSNIIHLDVKPANFMVGSDNVLMLTDFGLARKVSEVNSGTRDDELQGTPAYASPEHVMQEKPDLRTDMYCLGASLFHLMTGEFPFPGETTEEVCRAHVYSPFPIETLQRHNIPDGMDRPHAENDGEEAGRPLPKLPGDQRRAAKHRALSVREENAYGGRYGGASRFAAHGRAGGKSFRPSCRTTWPRRATISSHCRNR